MKFTTIKKKIEEPEKYDFPVLTQTSYNSAIKGENTEFVLNKAAMIAFGFVPNTPNEYRITNGYDDDNNLCLAAYDDESVYTSNITAKNSFASSKFMDRLVSEFKIDPIQPHEFSLLITEEDGIFVANIMPMVETVQEEAIQLEIF